METKKKLVPELRFPEFKDEWKNAKLSKLLKIGSGKDYKHLSNGKIPVFGTGGVMTFVDDYIYEGESVCIGRKGTIDKPVYLNTKFWTVDTLFYTHSFRNVLPKFVYSIFQNINWYKYNEASGVPSLSKKTIEAIIVITPTIKEQQKIASFLSAVDEKIIQLQRKKELLQAYKKGMMQQLFSQQLRFKNEDGNDFPDWEEKKLGDLGSFFSGGTPNSTNRSYYNGDIPFIGSGDISKDSVNQFITEIALNDSSAKIINKGDLLYALYGATSGEVAISKIEGAINQAVLCIRINQNSVFTYYILNFNKEKITSKYLQGGQGNLSGKIVKSISFSFPSKEEQTKIATFLSALDAKIDTVSVAITQTQNFKKGLLQQMFV